MSWTGDELLAASAALVFAVVLGGMVVNGILQFRDHTGKRPDPP